MKKRPEEPGVNMTPMIDVVFQLIIFFVCTADIQNKSIDESISLAMAPHGIVTEKKDPREINIDVDSDGNIRIARTIMNENYLRGVLVKAVAEHGQTTPVVIRGDSGAKHRDIKRVMDACVSAGLWKIKFAAIKEKA
jgi:biopolymer transport protein ExbD